MQLQVTNSPFNKEQTEYLNLLLPTLTETQRIWLSGYLAVSQNANASFQAEAELNATLEPVESKQPLNHVSVRDVTILYGTETGTAQMLAEDLGEKIKEREIEVNVSSLDDFKPKDLKKVQDLLIITATHGDGDPPENAISFYEFLHSRKAPKLNDVRFSVLSLGDQSYEFFCQTGKDFDKRLEELGAERLYARIDCDVDFDEPAAEWVEGILQKLDESKTLDLNEGTRPLNVGIPEEKSVYSRTNPFQAEVLENINLNGAGSNKETRHLELSLEGSNFEYEPGDSLGIYPQNDPELVEEIISELKWNPEESVLINKQGERRSVREAFLTHFEVSRLTKPLLVKAGELFHNDELTTFLNESSDDEIKTYIDGRDLLDLVREYPPKDVVPEAFIGILRKMPVRLYSITSSYKANPDEVKLLIGSVKYPGFRQEFAGVCSGQCSERVEPGDTLSVYIHRNPNFKFPFDPNTPVIMVGPGTGVAPFRSYLEELEELGIKGKTWLFFGEQHFSSDFLYQVEWQRWLKDGVLTKMDVAFSRDTSEKVYVQHRMREAREELYQWLQAGAHLYICGDEKNMAKDVHQTLVDILVDQGNMSQEAAESYLSEMRKQKRYQRDVY
ncbi:assimilatory sulfite reductase (NADPH) flavoprotein subunit [Oceanobacillus piezotolerans]|uniref:assimilatory sulfite reductase (NADPH) n=1 Tax=Oceanobacillus piezotolerans TaxID=2448030 RepID=A0A498D9U8_9BACI|nr:assimilatory sulfite reductase (NADPH) flavoprotein subunit [Oceanobacillus piezotolerans]RLL47741.1 assimilatory sulfite reductase (NADPH) flavoprotein subunit [Oceanobacillus piezotolerans]